MLYCLPCILCCLAYLLLMVLSYFLTSAMIFCKSQRQIQLKRIAQSLLVIHLLLVMHDVWLVLLGTSSNCIYRSKPLVHYVSRRSSGHQWRICISICIDRRVHIRSIWLICSCSRSRWKERSFCINTVALFIIRSLGLIELFFNPYFNWLHVYLCRTINSELLLLKLLLLLLLPCIVIIIIYWLFFYDRIRWYIFSLFIIKINNKYK